MIFKSLRKIKRNQNKIKTCTYLEILNLQYMSRIIRKPDFCLCENKDTDQLCSNCTADQRLLFLLLGQYNSSITSTQNLKSLSSETVQANLCQTRSETPKTGFLTLRLI